MALIGKIKAELAKLRDDNRGEVRQLEEVVEGLRELAPKLEEEFKQLDESGALGKPVVTIGPDKLPVPDSLYADYLRAKAELEKVLGIGSPEPKHEAAPAEPAPEAPAAPVAS